MQKRFFPALFAAAFLFIIIGFGCTKMDTTSLGSDLVTVDNINTFADTLSVDAAQGYFFNDSTIVQKADNHVIGNITTDPLFGKTAAAVYVQFKPTFYPFYFGNAGDTVRFDPNGKAGLDSAFVCLSYKGTWGDSSAMAIPQKFEIRQINDEDFRIKTDTLRKLNYQPAVNADLLGFALITPQIAKSKVILAGGKDSVENQIRIKLNSTGLTFINSLFYGQDSSSTGPNNAFYKDSIFRKFLHGFAITSSGPGNTLFYVNIAEAKSRLEFHFHKTKNGVHDTIVQSFQMYTASVGTTAASSSSDYIKRDYTGAPIAIPSLSDIYLQSSPGTFASLHVPALTGYTNRIVHRAYLIIEQTPFSPATDNIFTPPPYLYLDLKDTVTALPQRYKPVYFDLNENYPYNPDATAANTLYHPFPLANVDISNFGGAALQRVDGTGNNFTRYEINLTRYVQHIVTNGYHNYDMRLYAPYNYYYPQYTGVQYIIPFYDPLAFGRVRVGSGTNATHRMKIVIVYSKI